MKNGYFVCALIATFSAPIFAAPPIERVKISDNEMTCAQMHTEIGGMDKIIAQSKEAEAAGQNTATAGQAGGVAAEVASRTGIFGAFGGLAGHIFGSVAAKTAANVAEQSGQQSTQEAAEQGRQALARKEHVTTLFLNKGCKASDPNFEPKAGTQPPVKIALAPQPAAPLAMDEVMRRATAALSPIATELDLDKYNTGVAERPRVIVPGFRVAFVVKTVAKAYGGGGLANMGNTTGGTRTITQAQNKRVEMALAGADMALLQRITDQLYADFVERLRASGKEVIDAKAMAKAPGFEKMKYVQEKPYNASPWSQGDPRSYIVLGPSSLPLWFTSFDVFLGNAGPFEQENAKAIHEMCASLDAVAYIPMVLIDIAEIESSGRSMFRSGASADLLPKLGIGARSELRFMNGKDAKIFFTGDMGNVLLKKAFYHEGEFGQVKTVTAFDTASLANVLTAATGTQGAQHFVEKRELKVDPVQFATGALKMGATFNQLTLATLKQ